MLLSSLEQLAVINSTRKTVLHNSNHTYLFPNLYMRKLFGKTEADLKQLKTDTEGFMFTALCVVFNFPLFKKTLETVLFWRLYGC